MFKMDCSRAMVPWLASCVMLTASVARAELKPEEVAILAISASGQSRQLAEHYAEVRGVPKTQIMYLEAIPGTEVSRSDWETLLRPRILRWLRQNQLDTKVRCMVLSWDVPLRIGKRSDIAPEVVARKEFLTAAHLQYIQRAARSIASLESLARGGETVSLKISVKATQRELAEKFNEAIKAAESRLREIKPLELRAARESQFKNALIAGAGLNVIMRSLSSRGDTLSLADKQTAERLRGQLLGIQQGTRALSMLPDNVPRDVQLLELLEQVAGSLGVLEWIEQQQEALKSNESYASFESELSLIYWPDYPLLGTQPNLLHYMYDALPNRLATLMVSRLAAPRYELAEKLVDTAVAVEKTGLSGKVYLDARGIDYNAQSDKPGSYGQYDQSLRDLAERLKRHTKLEVVLDNQAACFGPGACPDAALYCGWYSLGNYIDSFTWRPGSVGYHLASMEAETLTTPGNKVWCNAMLEHGIAATLGPVWEPKLLAFPLPDDFFSLLLSGRYSLVESYYRTARFNSWVMVLVGDPLYNPFKDHPQLAESDLPDRLQPKPPAAPPAK
jgi:uncharacterized protein (TIGR03790 family)